MYLLCLSFSLQEAVVDEEYYGGELDYGAVDGSQPESPPGTASPAEVLSSP